MALNALRLAVGTLTVVPTGRLPQLDRRTAGWAIVLAPVAALPVALAAAALGWVAWRVGWPPLLVGAVLLGTVALGTRAMHLDGLADTVDGLGASLRGRDRALEVMRRGDVGPMGVSALILVLLGQAAAFGQLVDGVRGAVVAGVVLCASRAALAVVCGRGVPAARPDGLGVVVAGTVSPLLVVAVWVGMAVVVSVALGGAAWERGLLGAGLAVGVVALLVHRCVRRLGGVTGDVMGAAIEIALTALLGCVVAWR